VQTKVHWIIDTSASVVLPAVQIDNA
jgi:hypothetical protein